MLHSMINELESKVNIVIFAFFMFLGSLGENKIHHAFSRGTSSNLHPSVETNKAISLGASFKYRLSVGLTE